MNELSDISRKNLFFASLHFVVSKEFEDKKKFKHYEIDLIKFLGFEPTEY